MTTTEITGIPLIKAFKSDLFPIDRLDPDSDIVDLLSRILVTEYEEELFDPGPGGSFDISLTVADEAVLNLVGLDGFALVFGGASSSALGVGVSFDPTQWEVSIGAGMRLRFPRNILKPVVREGGQWVDDPARQYAELHVSAGIIIDNDWNVEFDGDNAFKLAPSMIADSGVVIEGEVALDLSDTRGLPESAALGLPASWKGAIFKSLTVHLPDAVTEAVPIANVSLTNFHIGSGGVTGSISLNGTPGDGTIGGFPFRPTALEVELKQNCLVRAEISGRLTLSFFDEPLDVVAGFDLDGNFTVSVASASGLVSLTKPGILSVTVDGLTLGYEDGMFLVAISGTITPLLGGLDWPGFKVEELSIDSDGNVRLEGGWLNLPEQYSLDFHGFHVGIARLGMGSTEDGGKWIGFSGEIKLVDGLSIGGSVDGLKVTWYDDGRAAKVTLDGVGVELEIPNVMRFKGMVSYTELPGPAPADPPQRRFDGDITLELLALDLRIDGKIVIGVDTDPQGRQFTFFALYIGVELPAGVPLFSTGLGLYGIAGIVAIEMFPNKGAAPNPLHPTSTTDEEWFENLDGSDGWYKRPTKGVTDLRSKWDPEPGGFALGGGVTIGTLPDNGFTFSGSLLLVVSFPGPVILLEGKADLLKERSTLTDDPLFRALVVLDFRAGQFLIGLDAKYKVGSDAELIEIGGSAEAFFDFSDASRWHLYLGRKDPRERRIRAEILSIFEANSYFMIDANSLKMGAWVGYDKRWSFGPLSVTLEAWIEGGVAVSWKPIYFHGEVWLHGKVELKVFGFGLGLHADARFACDVFDPFHILAELSVGINLPWPLPDFDVDITLEWGPTPDEPPLPLPLKEIAVEHFKSTASWPLPRANLLLPDVDDGSGFLALPLPSADLTAGPPAAAPVVPMDARPHITFGRGVHDDATIGVNPQPPLPNANPAGWEWIGDPEANQGPVRARYAVKEVVLARWTGSAWVDVARKGNSANPVGVDELFGSWAPMPQLPAGLGAPGSTAALAQVKLWLWSKSPFDYSVHGGAAWDEWFTDQFDTYPCVPPVPERKFCCDFDDIPVGAVLAPPMPCREHPELVYVGSTAGTVESLATPVRGHRHALCWDAAIRGGAATTRLPARQGAFGMLLTGPPAKRMTLVFAGRSERTVRKCLDLAAVDGRVVDMPLVVDDIEVQTFDSQGVPIARADVVEADRRRGFNLGWAAEVKLPCPADSVDVLLWQGARPATVTGFDGRGDVAAVRVGPDADGLVAIHLDGAGIERVVVEALENETILFEICVTCTETGPPDVLVTAVDDDGQQSGPYAPVGDTVTVEVERLRGVGIVGAGRVCLIEACATFPPDGDEVASREEMAKRLVDSMALWGDEGEVLEPNSAYRVAVVTNVQTNPTTWGMTAAGLNVTELAYFRTQGPPALTALSTPVHQPPEETFDSGLDDLVRYVHQTVPPTVPPAGERPLLPRPVYRAYDVGVEFNEDYVDLMYRLAGRDLSIYLYDANNQPVRDAAGRLIVAPNRLGVTETAALTDSTIRYLSVIDQAACVTADPDIIPHQQTLFAVDPGLMLDADIVYEARLVPLLLREDFRDGLDAWTIVDDGVNNAPSHWDTLGHPTLEGSGAVSTGPTVTLTGAGDLSDLDVSSDVVFLSTDTARPRKGYRIVAVNNAAKQLTVDGTPTLFGGSSKWEIPGWGAVVQRSNIWGGVNDSLGIAKPGTLLLGGQAAWTDYRFSVLVRSADNDAIGVVFRALNGDNHYRFSMDRERSYRRLVRVVAGSHVLLAEDDFVYVADRDYLVTVEAVGGSLRVYLDGELVFDVTDTTHAAGRIGLYCWGSVGARFADVRVDDFGEAAPVAYRFSFTTSDYADFLHHLHSYEDETWVTESADGALAVEIGAAVAPGVAVSDQETRSYAAFATKVLGPAAQTEADLVEVHRVTVGGNPVGLLVRSPEPIDWSRTALSISRASGLVGEISLPVRTKITDLLTGGTDPNDETVTVLARDRMTMARTSIEAYGIRGPLLDAPPEVLLDDTFDRLGGVLFEERFSASALDNYRIVDPATPVSGPSVWTVSGGAIVQTSNIYEDPFLGSSPARPGTRAITGGVWDDLRLTVSMWSGDDDAIGVFFRYFDDDNWYRFSMDRQRPVRRLVKSVDGAVTTLWEDSVVYDQNREYRLRIEAFGDLICGFLDEMLLFVVRDGGVPEGQVGLYCFANIDANFTELVVESLDTSPLLFEALFADLAEIEVRDAAANHARPSMWTVAGGVATQGSNVWGDSPPPGLLRPGSVALLQPTFGDADVSVRMTPVDNDGIGLVVRYQDDNNWYRFAMDSQLAFRRLDRCVGGVVTVLWQDTVPYVQGREHGLTFRAEGRRLQGWVDGAKLFDVVDDSFAAGRLGLYTWANMGATFRDFVVTDPVRRIGDWRIVDETPTGTSSWQASSGALRQRSNLFESGLLAARGTLALTGLAAWNDYRIGVRLRSDDDDGIGVVFRYVDPDNWYRLSLDAQRGFRRLVRCLAGVTTPLWEDTGSYTVGKPFELEIDAIGDRLVARQGDDILFDLDDPNHRRGAIGLYCWGNTGARFERVTVTLPPLDAYAVFRDRFPAGDLATWLPPIDDGTQSVPSNWAIESGALRQTSNIHSLPVDPAAIDKLGTQVVAGDAAWTDIVWTVRILADQDNDAIGFVFRYIDANNYYRFSMDRERSYRRLVKRAGGVFTTLWEDAVSYEQARSYDFTVASIGDRHTIWIDDVPLIEVDDATHQTGRIGLYSWAHQDARFSGIRVYEPDRLLAANLLSEDFDTATPGRWSVVTVGNLSGPAVWEVVAGELHQTSNVWGGVNDTAELRKPGTIAVLTLHAGLGPSGLSAGSDSWTDYRVSVRLRSTDDDAIGIVFRYQDKDNWYRFSMDRERAYRRLVRSAGGVVTELWSDGVQYTLGRSYLVTIDAIGDSLVGYVDGVELFSVRDGELAGGTIGLYCWGNSGAHFASVRVTSAGWSTHYRFGIDEDVVAAGSRIVVRSGNRTDWTDAPVPGVVSRFRANGLDGGRRSFPSTRALDLRLRDHVGEIGHARRFLPIGEYADVAGASVLRKADGTEFAVFAGNPLPTGQYRLRLTYRRDNAAAAPDSTRLTRAGDPSDEVVILDVPWHTA